jgi:hypothetical protein
VLRPDTSVPGTGLRTLNGVAIQPVIDSSGNIEMSGNYLLVKNIEAGTEAFTTNGEIGIINVFSDSTNTNTSCINFNHDRNNIGGNNRRYCSFQPNNTNFIAGSITGDPATVSYNTMSDRRVKTNITSIDNENKYRSNNNNDISYSWLESVNALTPYIYSFNTDYVGDNNGDFTYKHSIDASDISVNYQGFLADEVQQVYPPAVQGISGEVENNGTPVYQQLDMTKLIPMMVGAIKDLSSKVSTLEAYINDINGRISPNIKYTSTNGMFYYTINNTNASYDLDDYYKPIKDAIEKWDSLIGIPSIYTTTNNLNYTILNITINFSELESNVLGGAFVTHITSPGENTTNTYGNTFATNGVFDLNTLYLSQMKDNIYDNGLSQLYYTSLHEIGHILGIGPFWVLTDYISSIPRTAYQENGETKYYYTGINALQQYKDYFPDNISKDYIGIPLEDNGGSGTQNVHPEEGFVGDISTETRDISGITYYGLNDELMTGWSESSNIMPLSRVTLGFLEDIGYNVNYSLADDYQATYPIN